MPDLNPERNKGKVYTGLVDRLDAIGDNEMREVVILRHGHNSVNLRHTCHDYERMTGSLPRGGCHSPTGFSWGYGGSGPSELARMIMRDYFGRRVTGSIYQQFKQDFVAKWPSESNWRITADEINTWLSDAPWRWHHGPDPVHPSDGGPPITDVELFGEEWEHW